MDLKTNFLFLNIVLHSYIIYYTCTYLMSFQKVFLHVMTYNRRLFILQTSQHPSKTYHSCHDYGFSFYAYLSLASSSAKSDLDIQHSKDFKVI